MNVNERNAALNAATTQLADVCRACGEPATVTYPVSGGLDVGFCDAHDPDRDRFYWGTAFPMSDPGEWVGGRTGPFDTYEAADGHARDNGYDDEERRRFLVIRQE